MSENISEKRSQAARANGAKSRGPVTPQGKVNSSRNAVRHGLLASTVLVGTECRHNFKSLFDLLVQRFQPADGVELAMIEELAASTWRLRRVWAMESEMLDGAMRDQTAPVELTRMTAAFTGLASRPEIHLLHRYETRLHMMYQRSLHNLRTMRQADMRNEPGNSLIPHDDPASGNPSYPDFEPGEPVFLPPGPVPGHESSPHESSPHELLRNDTAPAPPEPPSLDSQVLDPTPREPAAKGAARCSTHHRHRPAGDRRRRLRVEPATKGTAGNLVAGSPLPAPFHGAIHREDRGIHPPKAPLHTRICLFSHHLGNIAPPANDVILV